MVVKIAKVIMGEMGKSLLASVFRKSKDKEVIVKDAKRWIEPYHLEKRLPENYTFYDLIFFLFNHYREYRNLFYYRFRKDPAEDHFLFKLLKKANCKGLYFGLESGSKRILEAYTKNITIEDIINTSDLVYHSGISMVTSVMIGLPQEKAEDIESTLNLMKKIKTHIFDINSYVPLPGTVLYDNMSKDKIINIDWKKTGYKSYTNFFSEQISQEEHHKYLHRAYEIAEETLKKFITKGSWGSS